MQIYRLSSMLPTPMTGGAEPDMLVRARGKYKMLLVSRNGAGMSGF